MNQKPASGTLRTLGAPRVTRAASPKRTKTQTDLSQRARKTLQAEFRRALALKEKIAGEAAASSDSKGRDANQADKLRSLVASLEGMSRFAIAMDLLTPEENRAVWAAAMRKGLYEGWR